MKKAVKILTDNVQSYEKGKVYRIHSSFADKLIRLKRAEEVKPEQKEEKRIIETKEEKHAPAETKDDSKLEAEKIKEASDAKIAGLKELSVKKLNEQLPSLTTDELVELMKDERVTVQKLVAKEIQGRNVN